MESSSQPLIQKSSLLVKSLKVSFYIAFPIAAAVWMLFFDGNDVLSQIRLHQSYRELQEEKEYLKAQVKRVKEEKKALARDPELLEKLSREKYFMNKKGEDVYIIESN